MGSSLEVQWLLFHAFTAGGTGSLPGQVTKIPHAVLCGPQKIIKKKKKRSMLPAWVKVGAAKHPTMHRTAHHNKELSSPKRQQSSLKNSELESPFRISNLPSSFSVSRTEDPRDFKTQALSLTTNYLQSWSTWRHSQNTSSISVWPGNVTY